MKIASLLPAGLLALFASVLACSTPAGAGISRADDSAECVALSQGACLASPDCTLVQDEGEGFSLEDLQNRGEDDDLWQESGRGLALMTLYMDCVLYYDNGSTLFLRKFIDLGSE